MVARPARHHQRDEALERALLVVAGERPVLDVAFVSFGRACDVSKQVLEPAVVHERIAFEVEEHVALGRGGQPRQPEAGRQRQRLVDRPVLSSTLHLDARLLAGALVGLRRATCGFPGQRQRQAGERSRGTDVVPPELVDLYRADPGHEAEIDRRAVASQGTRQRQISQCSLGSGYVPIPVRSASDRSSRRLA